MKLEKLLDELIEMGRKPFGFNKKEFEYIKYNKPPYNSMIYLKNRPDFEYEFSLNDLCSLDSGLWQFACENNLINQSHSYGDMMTRGTYNVGCLTAPFRLMLSSIQEDKEAFILNNIKLGKAE